MNFLLWMIQLILILAKLLNGLKLKEICLNCEIPMAKSTNTFICEKYSKCNGKYSYECAQDHCTIDKTSCHEYVALSVLSKIYRNDKFNRLITRIQECSRLIEWNSHHYCSRSAFCTYSYPKNLRPLMAHMAFREASCRCKKPYQFECDATYCASDKRACEKIYSRMFKIKSCI